MYMQIPTVAQRPFVVDGGEKSAIVSCSGKRNRGSQISWASTLSFGERFYSAVAAASRLPVCGRGCLTLGRTSSANPEGDSGFSLARHLLHTRRRWT